MSWYEVESSEVRYDGRLSRVRADVVRMPDGAAAEREIVEHVDAVGVVPITDDGDVVLVRQYRHAVGRYLLEIPAGILDVDGEGAEEAVRRELIEETGMAARELTEMGLIFNSAGWSDESTRLYLARGLSAAVGEPEFIAEHEESEMEVVRLPFGEAADMAAHGEIPDAKTVIGLLMARARLRGD